MASSFASSLGLWLALFIAAPAALAQGAARPPIVLAQSLPISGPLAAFSRQVIGGARAVLEPVNAQGGVHGRRIELLTLDDGGDPARHEANLRRAAREHRVSAFLNCAGDAACRRAASVAVETGIPLIGPMSGLHSLREAPQGLVLPLRAGHEREAAALAQQLRGMGLARVAVLSDADPGTAPAAPPHLAALQQAFASQGLALLRLPAVRAERAALDTALRALEGSGAQALLVDLSPAALDELAGLPPDRLARLPRLLLSLATPAVTSLTALFREQLIGFTTVVPNPEIPNLPLLRESERQSARHGSGNGMFEALEAYIGARVCVQALRQAGAAADGAALAAAMWQLGGVDLGGFVLTLDRQRPGASDWVQLALRGRDGRILK